MLKKIVFYTKVGCKLLKKDVINKEEYKKEYNKVAKTYSHWLAEMGKFTENLNVY